ncbi:hypothetical protein L6452_01479 [Arctium lappa]|uniref:Uncharacterized protein n=1 Tax=Arctium lappa TaxID=4217 RepID=A0ACB9FI40_ARCLA|nr:hypothetical protein L6452_01479 [Arctium lappa]
MIARRRRLYKPCHHLSPKGDVNLEHNATVVHKLLQNHRWQEPLYFCYVDRLVSMSDEGFYAVYSWQKKIHMERLTSLYGGPLEFLFVMDSTEDPAYHAVSRLLLDLKSSAKEQGLALFTLAAHTKVHVIFVDGSYSSPFLFENLPDINKEESQWIYIFKRKQVGCLLSSAEVAKVHPSRIWGDKCPKSDIVINQGPTSPLPSGIPTYTVEIVNTCTTTSHMIHAFC